MSTPPAAKVKVCVCPASASVALSVPMVAFAALFSAMLAFDSAMFVGALLGTTGVTEFDAAEGEPVPMTFVARTVKV